MTHNHYPSTPERATFLHEEKVQYGDGEIALGFRTKGDKLVLGNGSAHKYARIFEPTNMAWIITRSGNQYGIGEGYLISQRAKGGWVLPVEDLNITIGEPMNIPGILTTSDVRSVQLRWKIDEPGSSLAQLQIDGPSPFALLDKQIDAIDAAREQS
jgi:hypothetical protein